MPNKITLNTLSVRQDVKMKIAEVCDEVKDLLIRKNDAYGNSFMFPINVFSKATAKEQIFVRIDDKLNRIAKGQNMELVQEDTITDLIGYLVLLKVLDKFNQGDDN
jgi:hypothetical protein